MERKQDVAEVVEFKCGCGEKWKQNARHYDVVTCQGSPLCRMTFLVLQPKRNGPFEARARRLIQLE